MKNDHILNQKLDEKLKAIRNENAPTDPKTRMETAEKWRNDIISRIRMMAKLFEYDTSLLISPQRQDDWYADIAINTTGKLSDALPWLIVNSKTK